MGSSDTKLNANGWSVPLRWTLYENVLRSKERMNEGRRGGNGGRGEKRREWRKRRAEEGRGERREWRKRREGGG